MFVEVKPQSWEEAKQIGSALNTWIFRGHSDSTWRLTTTIERAAEQFRCSPSLIWIREKVLMDEFQRRAHHYIQSPPGPDDLIEWLALVQHYGGPTRLMDFTKSFYVAAFFAVETSNRESCVWAVNAIRLTVQTLEQLGFKLPRIPNVIKQHEAAVRFAETFLKERGKSQDFVVEVTPFRLNERMAIQKGVSLFPCNISKSFESNLCSAFELPLDSLDPSNAKTVDPDALDKATTLGAAVVKVIFQQEWQRDAYWDLRSMNIDAASLFPDLGGFARSLRYHLREVEDTIDDSGY